ncbi:hypothetical protein NDU88_004020 [Pleurodeles waltl]|uniref:Uncharacterized protein n=1 Tax=Pleurodeles waltl TaxID=8319 RepID=A0AAV7REK5_PLEWA|nr:hypothetical protein NDU88_004020 [Pleurodeles waltl]
MKDPSEAINSILCPRDSGNVGGWAFALWSARNKADATLLQGMRRIDFAGSFWFGIDGPGLPLRSGAQLVLRARLGPGCGSVTLGSLGGKLCSTWACLPVFLLSVSMAF